jgi:hypothetical protein
MIDLAELSIGSVVRLVSGSPKMVVQGFGPPADGPPGCPPPPRQWAWVIWWSDQQGLMEHNFAGELLTYPRADRPAEPGPYERAALAAEVQS